MLPETYFVAAVAAVEVAEAVAEAVAAVAVAAAVAAVEVAAAVAAVEARIVRQWLQKRGLECSVPGIVPPLPDPVCRSWG